METNLALCIAAGLFVAGLISVMVAALIARQVPWAPPITRLRVFKPEKKKKKGCGACAAARARLKTHQEQRQA